MDTKKGVTFWLVTLICFFVLAAGAKEKTSQQKQASTNKPAAVEKKAVTNTKKSTKLQTSKSKQISAPKQDIVKKTANKAKHVGNHAAMKKVAQSHIRSSAKVSLNQNFIEGVYSKVKIEDPVTVFDMVFDSLPDKVTVYPTENYFYFSFNANGRTIWGNLRLDAHDRDEGILHLGYFEYDENGKFQDIEGYEKDFTSKDGVTINKRGRFDYDILYKNKRVRFHLNDVGMNPPKKAKLAEDEAYVGPVFDESGVQFFLVFNKTVKHFMYVLNEEVKTLEPYRKLNKDVVVGRRTGFAFYNDKTYNRRVLIGVHGLNIQRNNYYDGPFDQLPDNYVDETNIRKYMEMAYPEIKGKINKYGHFKEHKGNRVMISPYYVYYDDKELSFVESCKQSGFARAKFYECITPGG